MNINEWVPWADESFHDRVWCAHSDRVHRVHMLVGTWTAHWPWTWNWPHSSQSLLGQAAWLAADRFRKRITIMLFVAQINSLFSPHIVTCVLEFSMMWDSNRSSHRPLDKNHRTLHSNALFAVCLCNWVFSHMPTDGRDAQGARSLAPALLSWVLSVVLLLRPCAFRLWSLREVCVFVCLLLLRSKDTEESWDFGVRVLEKNWRETLKRNFLLLVMKARLLMPSCVLFACFMRPVIVWFLSV
jgi:hypothetical protein